MAHTVRPDGSINTRPEIERIPIEQGINYSFVSMTKRLGKAEFVICTSLQAWQVG
jgi:hypothetical protein